MTAGTGRSAAANGEADAAGPVRAMPEGVRLHLGSELKAFYATVLAEAPPTALLDLIARRPELGEPLEGAEQYLAAEVVHAVTHEGARHLDDVLTRRTRISIETFDRGTHAAATAAALMAGELGWDDARRADEVDHYLRRVEAERQSQQKATDQEAEQELRDRRAGVDRRGRSPSRRSRRG